MKKILNLRDHIIFFICIATWNPCSEVQNSTTLHSVQAFLAPLVLLSYQRVPLCALGVCANSNHSDRWSCYSCFVDSSTSSWRIEACAGIGMDRLCLRLLGMEPAGVRPHLLWQLHKNPIFLALLVAALSCCCFFQCCSDCCPCHLSRWNNCCL